MTRKAPEDVRKKQIIEAAVAEFLEKGFENASMESIALRSHLTKGGLYHHFGGKNEILFAAMQSYLSSLDSLIDYVRKQSNPHHGLLLYIREYIKYWAKHPREIAFWTLAWAKLVEDQSLWPQIDEYTGRILGFLSGLLEAGKKQGVFRPHDSQAFAATLMTALDGAAIYVMCSKKLAWNKMAGYLEDTLLKPLLK